MLLAVCLAWSFVNFASETVSIIAMKGDPAFLSFMATRLALPLTQLAILVTAYRQAASRLPECLAVFTLTTSTEMLKDRTVVDAVIAETKQEKNQRNFRVFQAMRLMRREYMKMMSVDGQLLMEDGSEYGGSRGTAASLFMLPEC